MEEKLQRYKTGTTNIGIVCKDGVVIAADKRITMGSFISGDLEKVMIISNEFAVAFAGVVSDVQLLKKIAQAQLKLEEYRLNKRISAKKFANLFSGLLYQNIRRLSPIMGIANFVLGGKDNEGFHIYEITPDGAVVKYEKFVAAGSGSITAYGVLETLYKKEMTVKEGIELAKQAVNAAIQRDSASGQGIDIIIITKDGAKKVYAEAIENKLKI